MKGGDVKGQSLVPQSTLLLFPIRRSPSLGLSGPELFALRRCSRVSAGVRTGLAQSSLWSPPQPRHCTVLALLSLLPLALSLV